MHYDYLIVGAGLFGAVFAHEMTKEGKKCLVVEKRDHIAGNIYCETVDDIHVHKYGAHIFHTSNKKVWDYINTFAEFNNYINSPVASYKDELYNLPFNMNTFSKMWGIKTPQEAKDIIAKQIKELDIKEPKNLEEQALSLVGQDVSDPVPAHRHRPFPTQYKYPEATCSYFSRWFPVTPVPHKKSYPASLHHLSAVLLI